MDVDEILRVGYFDRIKLDGIIKPLYPYNGVEVTEDTLNKKNLDRVAHLRATLIGESELRECFTEQIRMDKERERAGIKKLQEIGNISRYTIAFVDILIIRQIKGLNITSYKDDIAEVMEAANKFALNIRNKQIDKVKIGIIDRVYVYKAFRKYGISKWMHTNLFDIVSTFGMTDIDGVVLECGDFSGEAEKEFGLNDKAYKKMLRKHYESVGYSRILGDWILGKEA